MHLITVTKIYENTKLLEIEFSKFISFLLEIEGLVNSHLQMYYWVVRT